MISEAIVAASAVRRAGRRRKHDCRTHGVQQRISNRLSTIYGGPKPLSRRTKILVAALILSIGIVSPWFICDSVLYEHAYGAQIDGCIMPVSSRLKGQMERVNAVEGQLVHAGDVLALIDQNEYRIAVGQRWRISRMPRPLLRACISAQQSPLRALTAVSIWRKPQ
jgi:multidrug resistance efflux pump